MNKRFNDFFWSSHKNQLIKIIDIAYASFNPIITDYTSGKISRNSAISKIKDIVRNMVYFDSISTNYVFLMSNDGILLEHPFDKDSIGKNLTLKYGYGDWSIQEMLNIANSKAGKGFTEYVYEYPDLKRIGRKISYIRAIPSLDCFIGTGIYKEEFIEQVNKLTLFGKTISFIILFLIVISVILTLMKINNTLKLLSKSKNRFQSIFNGIDHFIALLDENFNILEVNRAAEKMTGIKYKYFTGQSFIESSYWSDSPESRGILLKAIDEMRKGNINRYLSKNFTGEGRELTVEFSIYPEKQNSGESLQYIAEGKDVTEITKYQDEIYKLAYYDYDTRLPNERLFEKKVTELLGKEDQNGAMIAVLKISDLSFINSLIGFDAGTKLLQAFSKRLADSLSEKCIVGRLHGGYFVIYIPKECLMNIGKSAEEYLESICIKNPEPLYFAGHAVHVTIKMGAAVYPDHGTDYHELLKNALIAKTAVKAQPLKCIELFDASFLEKTKREKIIEAILKSGDLEESVFVNFQPIVFSQNLKLSGFEALARFSHPDTGPVSPLEFIPIAEKTGTINRIFSIVLERAAFIASRGKENNVHVSVNISALQLLDNQFQDQLFEILKKYNLPESAIPIEITESVLIESFAVIKELLVKLRDIGIKIYIDDFGTGFSSLSYVRNLPANILKLDKTFIDNIDTDNTSRGIIEPILTIAHNLGMEVIAEGVERAKQADILKEIKCNYLQGWYSGKPLSEEQALKMISES